MNKLQKIVSASLMALTILSAAPAMAASTTDKILDTELLPTQVGDTTGLGTGDVRLTIAKIIRVAMSLLGIVAVVIILIGGFTWMTAGGNEEKVGEAKKWIFAGIIGLAIILSAYAIASFVITNLVNATVNAGSITP